MDLATTIPIIESTARQAGEILRAGWGAAKSIEYKGAVNLVTDYDRRTEKHILGVLRDRFPNHRFNSEEEGDVGSTVSPYTWMVDPLDGTTNFAHGYPVFAVSIGLIHDGQVLLGIVYDPTRDEMFSAGLGRGARRNGEEISVSSTAELDKALLATGFAYDRRTARDNNVDNLALFVRHCQGIRRGGAAALDLCYVACGRLDGFWEMGLHPWDVTAGTLIVREAGGRVTDFAQVDVKTPSGRRIVASNALIHNEMIDLMAHGAR